LQERTGPSRSRASWLRTLVYWVATGIVAWEMLSGSLWDLLRIEYVRVVFEHLNYPLYVLTILAIWKIPCGVVLLVPRFPRLKEWAYAGAFFNYSGAAASHAAVGDVPAWWAGPLGFALITLVSYALRAPARGLASPGPDPAPRPVAGIVPLGAAAAILVVAYLTLPQGPPPFPFR
jgi:hypothetical protein